MDLALYNPMSPLFPTTNSLDISYSVLLSYLIGIFTGIFITLEYSTRYSEILYSVTRDTETKDTQTMDTQTMDYETMDYDIKDIQADDYDINDEDQDDYFNEEYIPDETEIEIEEIRNTIETLFIKKNDWNYFVSMNKIYKRVSVLYPDVSRSKIKEAMELEPPYVTGTEHGKKGYRYIMCV